MSLNIVVEFHSGDGVILLNINGRKHLYQGDNAYIIRFVERLRQRNINKGVLLAEFKTKVQEVPDVCNARNC